MAFTRGEKKLAVVCVLALAIPLGVAAFIRHINKTPIMAATPPYKPPIPNGYDLYVQAANRIKPANPPVDAVLDLKAPTDPKIRAARYSLARKDAWLKQNRAGFALFKKAQNAQSLAPPILQFGRNAPRIAIYQMARNKVAQSNAHWVRGDHNAALQSGLDIVQMGTDVQRGGDAMSFLLGCSLNHQAMRVTSDTVEHLNAPQARAAARRIEKLLATRWTLAQALAKDRQRARQDLMTRFENPNWRTAGLVYQQVFNGALTWKARARAQTISKNQIIADSDTLYARAIAKADLLYGNQSESSEKLGNPFVFETWKFLDNVPINQAYILTTNRVLMLRLALRAHQLEHDGAPPRNLQMLVPSYIEAVPADPYGKGELFRYRTDGATYTLWSIGPDGKDDGGAPIPSTRTEKIYPKEREKLPRIWSDSPGDYVAGKNH